MYDPTYTLKQIDRIKLKEKILAIIHGLVIKAKQDVMGLNPGAVYWKDVSDACYYSLKNNNKGSQIGHT